MTRPKRKPKDITYNCHIDIGVYKKWAEDITKITIWIADGLTYAGDERINSVKTAHSNSNNASRSDIDPYNSEGSAPVTFKDKCSKCHGDGKITCSRCDGTGKTSEYVSVPNYSGRKGSTEKRVDHSCSKCHGSGEVECPECGGRGYKERKSW